MPHLYLKDTMTASSHILSNLAFSRTATEPKPFRFQRAEHAYAAYTVTQLIPELLHLIPFLYTFLTWKRQTSLSLTLSDARIRYYVDIRTRIHHMPPFSVQSRSTAPQRTQSLWFAVRTRRHTVAVSWPSPRGPIAPVFSLLQLWQHGFQMSPLLK
jgi:hypothetical protein